VGTPEPPTSSTMIRVVRGSNLADPAGADPAQQDPMNSGWELHRSVRNAGSLGYRKRRNAHRDEGEGPLLRPLEHYLYRPHVRVTQTEAGKVDVIVDWPLPDWKEIPRAAPANDYVFSAVDGGTFNDNPVRLVHDAMAGLIGFNPRNSELANRAMFMIDPLVVQPTRIKRIGLSLVAVAEAMVGVVCRDSSLFDRRHGPVCKARRVQPLPAGAESPCGGQPVRRRGGTGGIGAACDGGWCSRQFRVHDFMLGRANMKQYLTRNFILRADNPLFDRWHTSDQGRKLRLKYAMREDGTPLPIIDTTPRQDYYLPIIPIADEGSGG